MDELIAWLRAALDEDERVARACPHKDWPQIGNGAGAVHIARWDPARVLAEVEAKRRILDIHHHIECQHDRYGPGGDCAECGNEYPCETTRLLAQPYAGRPGWREEWRA
jgi:hypothetical protein